MILGIDYGRAKIGLARAEGGLAIPWMVLRVTSREDALKKLEEVVAKEEAERVVVGVSEGRMAKEQEDFASELAARIGVSVETQDEALTTQDAQELALASGMKRAKRKSLEDAFAAALVLQSFLDATQS